MTNALVTREALIEHLAKAKVTLDERIVATLRDQQTDFASTISDERSYFYEHLDESIGPAMLSLFEDWLEDYNKKKGLGRWMEYPTWFKPSTQQMYKWFFADVTLGNELYQMLIEQILESDCEMYPLLRRHTAALGHTALDVAVDGVSSRSVPILVTAAGLKDVQKALKPQHSPTQSDHYIRVSANEHTERLSKRTENYAYDVAGLNYIQQRMTALAHCNHFTLGTEASGLLRNCGVKTLSWDCGEIETKRR